MSQHQNQPNRSERDAVVEKLFADGEWHGQVVALAQEACGSRLLQGKYKNWNWFFSIILLILGGRLNHYRIRHRKRLGKNISWKGEGVVKNSLVSL